MVKIASFGAHGDHDVDLHGVTLESDGAYQFVAATGTVVYKIEAGATRPPPHTEADLLPGD